MTVHYLRVHHLHLEKGRIPLVRVLRHFSARDGSPRSEFY